MSNSNLVYAQSFDISVPQTNQLIKNNDIVKVDNHHYMVESINNNVFTGIDMYGNKLDFFIDEVQKIVFDSNQQTNIIDFLKNNEKQLLIDTLKDVTQKLKSNTLPITKIKALKQLKKSTLEKLNKLDIEDIELSKENQLCLL
jgi:HKD family nuclease